MEKKNRLSVVRCITEIGRGYKEYLEAIGFTQVLYRGLLYPWLLTRVYTQSLQNVLGFVTGLSVNSMQIAN